MRSRARFLARVALAAALPASTLASRAAAQSHDEPQLVFTIYGGLSEGSALWSLPTQALAIVGSSQQDTVSLARRLRPGLIAGLVTTYYASPHLGYSFDLGYFG